MTYVYNIYNNQYIIVYSILDVVYSSTTQVDGGAV